MTKKEKLTINSVMLHLIKMVAMEDLAEDSLDSKTLMQVIY